MTSLDDAWGWYQAARRQLSLIRRVGERHWDGLPWGPDSTLGRDDEVREVEGHRVVAEAERALEPLDDLAVLVLFSAFEATVRAAVLEQLDPDRAAVRHPVARSAVDAAVEAVRDGSFFRVLDPFKTEGRADLIEQVNQVRRYRNWVAHGRRGDPPPAVNPKAAYDRLTRCLVALIPATSNLPLGGEP